MKIIDIVSYIKSLGRPNYTFRKHLKPHNLHVTD